MSDRFGFKEIGIVVSALVGLAVLAKAYYALDCYILKTSGDEYFITAEELKSEGAKEFVTVGSYLAGQKKIEKRFDSWELEKKQGLINDYDKAYGVGCKQCDDKLKNYYDWLKLERDKLIQKATEGTT